MELSLVFLLLLAGSPLSQSLPVLIVGTDISANAGDVRPEVRNINNILFEANKGIPGPFYGGDTRPKMSRSAKNCNQCQWKKSPDGNVPVPFVLGPGYEEFEKSMIETVMQEFETMTCIRFVNRSNEQDYLSIESGKGCWSYVGRNGGRQVLSLSVPSCIHYGLIPHELMHSLGFFHEHTREDRDNYIEVNWENIAPANKAIFNFDDGNHQDLPYDYNSIMHYDRYSFSKVPGQPVMVPKPNRTLSMGESPGMDNLDVMKINRLYKCDLCRMKFVNKSDTFTYNSTSSGSSCFYLIQTFIKVLLQLSNLSVPVSPGCNDAYIKVYDGTSTSSPLLLNKTCGSDIVPPLVSSGRFMLIEIVNNQPSSPSSFSGSYDTVKYGATYLSNTGLVSSPAFPLFPPRNADMVFSIIAPKDKRVSLTINYFWLKPTPTCSIEYLTVSDVMANTTENLAKYCGALYGLQPLVSTGNAMVLNLRTGDIGGYNGFISNYEFVTAK